MDIGKIIALIKSIGGNNSPAVQSDWLQNDSTAPDYVKNRPFYTGDPVLTELFDVCALVEAAGASWVDNDDGAFIAGTLVDGNYIFIDTPPAIGDECIIVYNGTSYNTVAIDGDGLFEPGMICIGDTDMMTSDKKTYGVFIVLAPYAPIDSTDTSGKAVLYVAYDYNGVVPTELKVIGKKEEVKKIDSKYIDFPEPPEETDPNVPDWAKQPEKPSYTAEEVGALPDTTPVPFIVTVNSSNKADCTAKQIVEAANAGKVCILIHKGAGNKVFVYRNGNLTSGSADFVSPSTENNRCTIHDYSTTRTGIAELSRISFEEKASETTYGVMKIGDGLKMRVAPGLDNGIVDVSWIMNSSTEGSTKKFKLSVDDSGTISATEVTT